MADTVLTLRQVEDLFQSLTTELLGVASYSPKADARVRIGWNTNGAPAWKINEDVTFLFVGYDDDPITQQRDVSYQNGDPNSLNREVSYTRVLRVNWACYGPNSFNDADQIKHGLYLPSTTEKLQKSNMAMILDVISPMRSPELFQGQWWERATFYARFNEKVTRTSTVPTIEVSDVRIVKG